VVQLLHLKATLTPLPRWHLTPLLRGKERCDPIAFYAAPYAQNETRVKNLRDLCESDFEREVYDALTERGYKVIPQVKVGTYRIDMVVEGNHDARLAIECDGDRYHDASKWEDDMNRQRTLERVGWQFWRCFASTFVMNKDNVLRDLIENLTERCIEPIGSEDITYSIHSEHRKIRVFAQEAESNTDDTSEA
jgi:very-short-patch-repair endonuclease